MWMEATSWKIIHKPIADAHPHPFFPTCATHQVGDRASRIRWKAPEILPAQSAILRSRVEMNMNIAIENGHL